MLMSYIFHDTLRQKHYSSYGARQDARCYAKRRWRAYLVFRADILPLRHAALCAPSGGNIVNIYYERNIYARRARLRLYFHYDALMARTFAAR